MLTVMIKPLKQALCKISAMTFISKRIKDKLFYHFHPV